MSRILRATWVLLLKELRIELRTGEVVVTTGLFATLVAVLTSLSFYIDRQSAALVAPGVLWITVTFAGVLAMGRSWTREREHDVFRGLLLSPTPRAAIYLSKLAATLVFLGIVELILLLLVGLLFNLDLTEHFFPLALLLAMGTVGFAATGNLFAALSVRTRAREMVLAVMVFPVVAPALLSGVVATRELLGGAPLSEVVGWIQLLGAVDIAFLVAGVWLFEPLVSD
ncbi:MAG: heme exporter protein CcmB [Myxococcales bacterium]|nr:heme exporter protein CcmB [Myxococcales bacterium]